MLKHLITIALLIILYYRNFVGGQLTWMEYARYNDIQSASPSALRLIIADYQVDWVDLQ